jgi:hypothetical protein
MNFLVHFRALSVALRLTGLEGIILGLPSPELARAQGITYPYSHYRG